MSTHYNHTKSSRKGDDLTALPTLKKFRSGNLPQLTLSLPNRNDTINNGTLHHRLMKICRNDLLQTSSVTSDQFVDSTHKLGKNDHGSSTFPCALPRKVSDCIELQKFPPYLFHVHLGSPTFDILTQFDRGAHMRNNVRIESNLPIQEPVVDGYPLDLPVCLASIDDKMKLSEHQYFLRFQIEAFKATEDDVAVHARGRNKPIVAGQVGIRCRHCAHLPVVRRQKGSAYFPSTISGIYQAAQNMSSSHIQCGLCHEMPDNIKEKFKHLIAFKSMTTGAGRPYWASTAKRIGLVDTEEGIRFIRDIPIDHSAFGKS